MHKQKEEQTKLLVVADTYSPKTDGIVVFLENVLPKLRKEFDLTVLAPRFRAAKNKKEVLLPTSRLKYSGLPFIKFSFSNLRKINREIKKNEIIWMQGPSVLSLVSIFLGKLHKKKMYYYIHVIPWEAYEGMTKTTFGRQIGSWMIRKFSVKSYNRCDQIMVPYQALKENLTRIGVKTHIEVAKLGVDIDRFSPSKDKRLSKRKVGIKEDKTVIGYVGRISKEKNPEILLEAFKKLEQQSNLQLLMVGDGPEDQVAPFKGTKNCKVTGFVDNVQSYLKAMDIFVMPSLTETTSLATLEAMATGLSVIVTKVGFMKKYVLKDHNGLFFPRNSSGMLALKIKKLIEDKEFRASLGRRARKTVAYSFSWERSINRIKKLLVQ